jgi:sporulation protein YlmC with PRC-barrel domain
MTDTATTRSRTSRPLIESDRVEGTTVYAPNGTSIGSIKRLMIDKVGGKIAYAVMSFGGFLGMGAEEFTVPWDKLNYDTSLGGYRTDITEAQLRGAPKFVSEDDDDYALQQPIRDPYAGQ